MFALFTANALISSHQGYCQKTCAQDTTLLASKCFTLILMPGYLGSCTNTSSSHYENMPMQYLAIFHSCKTDNFQMKNVNIFLIFAQKLDCGYTLEPPQ